MLDPNNPFADLIPPAQDPNFSGYRPGRPKAPPPPSPVEVARLRLAENEDRRQAVELDYKLNKPEKGDQTPGDIDAQSKGRIDAVEAFNAGKALYDLTKDMRAKFRASVGDPNRNKGVQDWLPTQENTAFDQAGGTARGYLGTALGFTGGQLNSVAEAKAAIGPYLPNRFDYDENALSKIRRIDEIAYKSQQKAVQILGGVPDAAGNIIPLTDPRAQAMLLPDPREWEAETDPAPPLEVEVTSGARGEPLVLPPKNKNGGGTTPPEAARGTNIARGLGLGFGDVAQAAGDVLGLVSNPLNAGINALTGSRLGTDLGASLRSVVGAPTPVTNEERLASAVNRGGVGALSLSGAARAGGNLIGALSNTPGAQVVGNALARFAPTPLRDAGAGAIAGGASDLTRQAGGGPIAQAGAGLLAGGVAAAGMTPGVARSLVGRSAPTAEARPVIRSAVDEGIQLPKVMVSGNRRDAIKAGMLEADPTTAVYAQNAFENVNEQIGGRVSALAQGGRARDRAGIGEDTRAAAVAIRDADRQGYRAAYEAAEAIDGDPLVNLVAMRARLTRDIARLRSLPGQNRDTIAELQRVVDDIAQPVPLSAVREMRTNLREGIDNDLSRPSSLKRADQRALAAIEGANVDIRRALSPEGREAWAAADGMFAQAQTTIREALRPFVGKDFDQLPAEAIFDRLKGAANGNGRALAELHRRLPPRLSRDIATTFAESMGKAGGEASEQFSAIRFLADARKFSPSARATLFGPSGATSIENLLRVSRRLRNVQSEINRSKTARPVQQAVRRQVGNMVAIAMAGGGALMTGGVGGATAGAAAGIATMAAGAQLNALSARALMNPRTTRWLETLLDVNTPGEARQAAARLAVIMDREPTIANDLQPYHDVLTHQMTAPVAASEPDRVRRDR